MLLCFLPEESAGCNGQDAYLDCQNHDAAQISATHPITAGYTVGENITDSLFDARFNVTAMAGTTVIHTTQCWPASTQTRTRRDCV